MNITQKILGKYYDVPLIKLLFEFLFVILPIAFAIRTFFFGLYQVPTGSMETTLLVGERFFADKLSYWFRKPVRGEIIAFNQPDYNYSENKIVNLWENYFSLKVSNWTKRLIALPGDNIKGVVENGKPVVYLNGEKLDESAYLNKYPLISIRKYPHYLHYGDYKESGEGIELRPFDPELDWKDQKYYKIDPSRILLNRTGEPSIVLWPGTPTDKDIFNVTLGENQYWAMGDNRLGSSDSRAWGILNGKLIHGKIIYRIWSMDTDYAYWFADLISNPIGFWKKVRWSRCFQSVK